MLTVNEYAATNQFLCNRSALPAQLYSTGMLVWRLFPFRASSQYCCVYGHHLALSAPAGEPTCPPAVTPQGTMAGSPIITAPLIFT